jgi:hypothetical protein
MESQKKYELQEQNDLFEFIIQKSKFIFTITVNKIASFRNFPIYLWHIRTSAGKFNNAGHHKAKGLIYNYICTQK